MNQQIQQAVELILTGNKIELSKYDLEVIKAAEEVARDTVEGFEVLQ